MASVFERIAEARDTLVREGFPAAGASIDAEVLAMHVLGWTRAALLTRGGDPATESFACRLRAAVQRRLRHEPVAHITERREFWGLDFEVNQNVLVPRPETELIVEAALACARRLVPSRIADIGTGSGCLAVTLARELPRCRVLATDLSLQALAVARRNAFRHGVSDRIAFLQAHLLETLRGPLDLIVSNPPYVPTNAPLPPDVRLYEPPLALFAGDDGLAVLRELITRARASLTAGGHLIVEFGHGQSAAIRDLASHAGWRHVEIRKDLQGIDRVAVLTEVHDGGP